MGKKKRRPPPWRFTHVYFLQQLSLVPQKLSGKDDKYEGDQNNKRKQTSEELNWSKNLDVMRIDVISEIKS